MPWSPKHAVTPPKGRPFFVMALVDGPTLASHCRNRQLSVRARLRLFLRDPKEEIRLEPGESYAVRAGRPHLVTNGGTTSAVFLVLQGVGEYDYVPLT